jgi:hypothetical protein
VGATAAPDGTPIAAWSDGGRLANHIGVDQSAAAIPVPAGACCSSRPAVGVDVVGSRAYVVWFSEAPGSLGLVAQAIGGSGPGGRVLYAPGSAARGRAGTVAPGQRIAVSGRTAAPGVYVAYGTVHQKRKPGQAFTGLALWRIGASKPLARIRAPGADLVALAAAPEGRLWLAWSARGKLFAARTNRAATRIGGVRTLPPPARSGRITQVQGEGSLGPLDLVVDVRVRGRRWLLWHEQVLPALTLRVSAHSLSGGTTRYVFAVSDAGDAVANAAVRVGKQVLTTGASGTVVLQTTDLPRVATAVKPGYAPATTAIPAGAATG